MKSKAWFALGLSPTFIRNLSEITRMNSLLYLRKTLENLLSFRFKFSGEIRLKSLKFAAKFGDDPLR